MTTAVVVGMVIGAIAFLIAVAVGGWG